MGLLDNLLKGGGLADLANLGSDGGRLLEAAQSMLDPSDASVGAGFGLDDVMKALQSSGLDDALQSWLGSGANQSIGASDIAKSLPDDLLTQFAGKAGIDVGDASGALASILPSLIDQLSPSGSAPSGNDLGGLLGSVISSLGKR